MLVEADKFLELQFHMIFKSSSNAPSAISKRTANRACNYFDRDRAAKKSSLLIFLAKA